MTKNRAMAESGRARGSDLSLLLGQIRYQNKIFWRTPVAAFFTLVFPLILLLIFATIFGNDPIEELSVTIAQFYAPALAVYGAATAAYVNLAISTALARDEGILKRVRGTPLPPWIYLAGRVGSSAWIGILAIVIMLGAGVALFEVDIIGRTLVAAIVTLIVSIATFSALGLMLASIVRNGDSMPAVTNATLLPLAFVSNVFIAPFQDMPTFVQVIGDIFPLKHFAAAFSGAFNPALSGSGFQWSAGPGEYAILSHLAVLAVWGVGASLVALRYFTWEPRGSERATKEHRRRRKETKTGS